MQTIPEIVESLQGVRHAELNIQRIITVLLAVYETNVELQERIRNLENAKEDAIIPVVKLKVGAKAKNNDSQSIDKET